MYIFKKFKILLFMVLIGLVLGLSNDALASDIILKNLNGQAVNLSTCKGRPVLLFFWTTWCPYCRKEIKALNQNYVQIEKEGIIVFGINIGESDYKVQKFFKGYQLNFKILLDKAGLLADKYSLMGVPTFILLNKSGQVISQTQSMPDNYKSLLLEASDK